LPVGLPEAASVAGFTPLGGKPFLPEETGDN
jgi:hypothetical protein